jgi:hypothetical protein
MVDGNGVDALARASVRYTCGTSAPGRPPALVTVNVAVTVSSPSTSRSLYSKVV